MAETLISIYGYLLPIMMVWAVFWFIFSVAFKRNDVADIAWGLGFMVISFASSVWGITFLSSDNLSGPKLLMLSLVVIWAFRLSMYIGVRNAKKTEDFRYKAWREEWGSQFYVRSLFQVFILQAALALIVALPLVISNASEIFEWHWIHFISVLLWLVGFYWQAVGDYQKSRFKAKPENEGQIIRSGLWRFSRHPNYFGEIVMWWSLGLFVLPLPMGWLGLIGPLTITYLLRFVSGVPMLEAKYKDNPEFEAYKQNVPALFPFKIFK